MSGPPVGGEPHAILYGNLGAVRRRTGIDIVWVDGQKTYHNFKTTSVLHVRPGPHELKIRFVWTADRLSNAVMTTTVDVKAGRAYRFWAAGDDSFLKGNKWWAAFVQSTTDVELLDLPAK